jgi:hypothetical protein
MVIKNGPLVVYNTTNSPHHKRKELLKWLSKLYHKPPVTTPSAPVKSVTGLESAKSFTAETVAAFIPDGADPATWLKALRNVESAKPKPKAASAVAATSPAPGITTPNASPEPSFLLR